MVAFDLVIRNGTVVDGSGLDPYRADVGVVDGRIAALGRLRERGEQEIDAEGHVVTPGFVDAHTHLDAQVFWDPNLTPSGQHGVTTVIAGNCGFSIAPIDADHVELLARTLQHVEDMSLDTLEVGVPWDEFETFPQYLDAVERRLYNVIGQGDQSAGLISRLMHEDDPRLGFALGLAAVVAIAALVLLSSPGGLP